MRLKNKSKARKSGPVDRQQRNIRRVAVLFVVLAFLWVFFAPRIGVFTVYLKKKEQYGVEKAITRLAEDNIKIRSDIEKINNDPRFLEEEARRRGYSKENERIFDFSK